MDTPLKPKGSRVKQKRGPKPPKKARRRERSRSLDGLLYGGFSLDRSDRHLQSYHRSRSTGEQDDTYFRITRALVVAARRWRKLANDRIKPLNQTMTKWETLYLVAYSGEELTQSELARLIGVEGPTMVRILHMMAADGLLERHQSAEDLRVTINRITDKGRAVIAEIMNITNTLRAEILHNIDPEDMKVAHRVLTQIVQNLEVPETLRGDAPVGAGGGNKEEV